MTFVEEHDLRMYGSATLTDEARKAKVDGLLEKIAEFHEESEWSMMRVANWAVVEKSTACGTAFWLVALTTFVFDGRFWAESRRIGEVWS